MTTNRQYAGYTIIEIMTVMTVIGLLMIVAFVFVPDAQRQARDKERQSDIDTIHSRLEEYYQDKGSYPSSITAAIFPRVDPSALKSPNDESIRNDTPVSDQFSARESANPTISGPQYSYTAYPTSCTTNCVGYILKSYIESPSVASHLYLQSGLNNN